MNGRVEISPMSDFTPPAVILEAHNTLKRLLSETLNPLSELTQAALTWLEERQMVEAQLDDDGQMFYEITPWGCVVLLGRQSV